MSKFSLVIALLALGATSQADTGFPLPDWVTALATFDGSGKGADWKWSVTNDPVMGGVSRSTFSEDKTAGLLEWNGECRIVPK